MNVAEIIRKAKRPERTVPLCLALDLVAEYESLDRELAEVRLRAGDSLDGGEALAIAQRMDALRAEMSEHQITVRLRALSRLAYDRLFDEHPPRRDADGEVLPADAKGFNRATFYPAMIRASWVEPELDAETLDHLLDEVLSNRQFDEVAEAALLVNRGPVDIPFSPAASTILHNSVPE